MVAAITIGALVTSDSVGRGVPAAPASGVNIPGFTPDGWMTHTAPDFSGSASPFWRFRWTADNGAAPYGDELELRATSGGASINTSAGALPTYSASSGTAENPFRREWDTSTWSPTLPGWIKADMRAAFTMRHLRIRNGGTANRAPKDWVLEGSNDDSAWTTILSTTGDTGWGVAETRAYHLPDAGAFRYFRLTVTAVDGGTSPNIEEIALAPSADAVSYITDPRQFGTAHDTNFGRPRRAMFDGTKDTGSDGNTRFWSSIRSHGWVGVRLLSQQTVNEVAWCSVLGATTNTPSAGVVERSPDGLRWTQAWSVSGWTSWASGEDKVATRP